METDELDAIEEIEEDIREIADDLDIDLPEEIIEKIAKNIIKSTHAFLNLEKGEITEPNFGTDGLFIAYDGDSIVAIFNSIDDKNLFVYKYDEYGMLKRANKIQL